MSTRVGPQPDSRTHLRTCTAYRVPKLERQAVLHPDLCGAPSCAHPLGKEADKDWGNVDFHNVLDDNSSAFNLMIESWTEQRRWGVEYPIENLKAGATPHPLLPLIEAEFAAMNPAWVPDMDAAGYAKVTAGTAIRLTSGPYKSVTVDGSGAVTNLQLATTGESVASPTNRLGVLNYQTLVLSDFETWQAEYIRAGTGGQNEFGKPASFMLAEPTPTHRMESPVLTTLWRKGNNVVADLVFTSDSHENAGAPQMARFVMPPWSQPLAGKRHALLFPA
jgi:hypothetical protein